ncbi:MAG: acylphosphatase [Nocardioidaceae bacterium]
MTVEAGDVARDVVVRGFVQGVFFRGTCLAEARSRHVRGWVANDYDGTVRAHFEGSPEAVEALVAWCHEGPRHAQVDRVDVSAGTVEGMTAFEVR